MKYVYNEKISQKANESLSKRARKVTIQKRILAIIGIVIVSFLIILGSSIRTFASAGDNKPLHKYYTSIRIEKGDSLWNLADEYTVDGLYDRDSFIEETCELNHISDQDQLRTGSYIVVGYYSDEIK